MRSGNLQVTELPGWTFEAPLLGWAMELGTQCKIKMCNSLFEKYQDFQDGNSTALNQVWGLSEH